MSVGKCRAGSEKWWGSQWGRDMRSRANWARGPQGPPLRHETPQPNKIFHLSTSRLLFQKNIRIYPISKQVRSLNTLDMLNASEWKAFSSWKANKSPENWEKCIFHRKTVTPRRHNTELWSQRTVTVVVNGKWTWIFITHSKFEPNRRYRFG